MIEETICEDSILKIALKRVGAPVEIIEVEYGGNLTHPEVARKLAEVLELEAEELLAVLTENPDVLDQHRRHCHLEVTCIDLHFETESKMHRFPARSKWERVHRWGCKKFKVATDACANLELRDGGPKGPVLNESKPIGHHEGCLNVWLVKPGPEPNGR